MSQRYDILGLMSGSSLDGLDVAWITFEVIDDGITDWMIRRAETIAYDEQWSTRLREAPLASGVDLWQMHQDYGRWCGEQCLDWSARWQVDPDLIASHGHTIYHRPATHMTCQIGSGAQIAAITKCPVVSDLRSIDIALEGEGAPMAVLADVTLFGGYTHLVNLGGIANYSCTLPGAEHAADICACNQWLDRVAQRLGQPMDRGGAMAREGIVDTDLASVLDTFAYYLDGRSSLANEECTTFYHQVIETHPSSIKDQLHTLTHHIAKRISSTISSDNAPTYEALVTGGGAHNDYLLEITASYLQNSVRLVKPDDAVIDYKEALLVALAGLRRYLRQPTFLAPYSRSGVHSVGGALYQPGL